MVGSYQNANWGKYEHGKYDEAKKLGYKKPTLKEYDYVSNNVKSLVRTNDLSYSHHKCVAPIAVTIAKEKYNKSFTELTEEEQKPIIGEQKNWLDKDRENEWSYRELNKAIREAKKDGTPEIPEGKFASIYFALCFLKGQVF